MARRSPRLAVAPGSRARTAGPERFWGPEALLHSLGRYDPLKEAAAVHVAPAASASSLSRTFRECLWPYHPARLSFFEWGPPMSVAAQSPLCGSKRLRNSGERASFDASEEPHFGRRVRQARGVQPAAGPSGHFSNPFEPLAGLSETFSALKALFPTMDDQVVSKVLDECGENIDQAIKRLHELQLQDAGSAMRAEGQAGPKSDGTPDTGAGPSTPREAVPEDQLRGPQSAEEWIDALVTEMSAAADVPDARQRAARVLQAFESSTRSRVAEESSKEIANLRRELSDQLRDNGILKRAVTIQNQRIQEAQHKDHEMAQLRHLLQKYQEKLQTLEMSNYSLSVHLRHAFSPAPDRRPPDVF